MTDTADIINFLADLSADHPLAQARARRDDALHNAQLSFSALLEPERPGTFTLAERYAVATYVAGLHRADRAHAFYADLLADESDSLPGHVDAAIERGLSTGPYGVFRESELTDFSEPGGFFLHDGPTERLAGAFDIAHLLVYHPRDSRPEAIGHLYATGWSSDDIVSLAQLVSFFAFQLRVVHGLRVVSGQSVTGSDTEADTATRGAGEQPDWRVTDDVLTYEELARPERFVAHPLGWHGWVPPVDKKDLTAEQVDSLIKPERADMPYFRLLARDPAALKARTLTDLDIFYNTDGGLGRAERELAATVVSRLNGCIYCASVHQGRTKDEGGDAERVDALLADGVDVDLGSKSWNQLRDLSVALTVTPMSLTAEHIAGLDWAEALDAVYSAAFFNWANRLMLFLGEPEVPRRFR